MPRRSEQRNIRQLLARLNASEHPSTPAPVSSTAEFCRLLPSPHKANTDFKNPLVLETIGAYRLHYRDRLATPFRGGP